MTTIEILYFDSCPSWRRTEEDVRRVVADAGIGDRISVRLVLVKTDDEAQRLALGVELHSDKGWHIVPLRNHHIYTLARLSNGIGVEMRLQLSLDGQGREAPIGELPDSVRSGSGLCAGA